MKQRTLGFTLIELMITVGILGVIVAVAYPAYKSNYIASIESTAEKHLAGLRLIEENYFLNNKTYVAGTMTGGGGGVLETQLGFEPSGKDAADYKYEVTACSGGDISECYKATVTSIEHPTISAEFEKTN